MSPAHSHLEQSRNTLLFASCAKEVTTNAQVNVVMSDKDLVKHMKKELSRLENELKNMSMAYTKGDTTSVLKEKERQIEMVMKLFPYICFPLELFILNMSFYSRVMESHAELYF